MIYLFILGSIFALTALVFPAIGIVSLCAILPAGLIGSGSGKMGNVVLSKWKSIKTVRAYQPIVRQNETTPLLTQRSRFRIFQHVASACIAAINIGFQKFTSNMSAYNYFIKQNIMNAMTGSYPSWTVDFSKLKFSSGTLEGVDDPANSAHTVSQWEVEWTDNSGIGAALATDKVYLLLVKDGSELTGGVKLCSPVNRSVGISVTTLPAAWAGQTLSQYLIIVSLDGQRVSDSQYVGSVEEGI